MLSFVTFYSQFFENFSMLPVSQFTLFYSILYVYQTFLLDYFPPIPQFLSRSHKHNHTLNSVERSPSIIVVVARLTGRLHKVAALAGRPKAIGGRRRTSMCSRPICGVWGHFGMLAVRSTRYDKIVKAKIA